MSLDVHLCQSGTSGKSKKYQLIEMDQGRLYRFEMIDTAEAEQRSVLRVTGESF